MPREKRVSPPAQLDLVSEINIRSSVAVYQQVENLIQFAIASQQLKPGEQLPSVRELSERLELNPNTVAKAYRDLEVMGYLYTRRGMGVFIQPGVEVKCRKECHQRVIRKVYEAVAEAQMAGLPAAAIQGVFKACKNDGVSPYGDVPAEVMKLVK